MIDEAIDFAIKMLEETKLTASQQKRLRAISRSSFGNDVTALGKSMTVKEWAEERGVKPATIYWRLEHGWNADDAVSLPVMRRSKR